MFSNNYPTIDVHVMDVSQALNGHRLCEHGVSQVGPTEDVHSWTSNGASSGSEWVAQIRGIFSVGGKLPIPGLVYYKNESFQPNYRGGWPCATACARPGTTATSAAVPASSCRTGSDPSGSRR